MIYRNSKIINSFKYITQRLTLYHTMDSIVDVEIDTGKFKYILIKLMDGANNKVKYIVRGNSSAAYHGDIFDDIEPQLASCKIAYECVGGGRIIHNPEAKTIMVYGYSQGYGKADHSITCELLKKKYANYTSIKYSDEGY